ncbi:hypothetical protein C8R41DRAFT_862795 [Lentinula lateritia]|uniref:DUF6534 domain-containing protein n=1 Tax=Lentinula lateritia TaxID=40482 RepID=A0ABQ8VXT8_9AGAR|nr:hypothetical protein C8R41DRAFT_862795 [Lentinula lateritia]
MASAMSSSTTTVAPLHNTMGALLIGVLISCALWGISTAQTYIYFSVWRSLRPRIIAETHQRRFIIMIPFDSSLCVLDTAHQIMLSHSIYIYLVSNFGNVEYLEEHTRFVFHSTSKVMVLLSVHVLAHLDLYDRFCSIFSRSTDGLFAGLSVAQIIIVFTSFAITMVYFKKSWSLRTWTKLADLSKISRAVNGLNFGGDIAITFVMNRCSNESSDVFLSENWTSYNISIWPDTFIYITFYCALARLYANSFLATLNARDQLRKSHRPIGSSLFSNPTLSGLEWARAMASDTVITSSDIPKSGTNPLSIKQEVETHVHHDIELDNLAVKTLSSILPA